MDAIQSFYYNQRQMLDDDDFDKLKEDLSWEGSQVSRPTAVLRKVIYGPAILQHEFQHPWPCCYERRQNLTRSCPLRKISLGGQCLELLVHCPHTVADEPSPKLSSPCIV